MKIFPAIDIIDGKVVRLTRGNFGEVTPYPIMVEEAAAQFKIKGATCLHVVDLDGAKSGKAQNAEVISNVIKSTKMFVEVGGGVRTFEQIESYLRAGAGRVILGTAAVNDLDFTLEAVRRFGGKIAVGVDASKGKVAISGWRDVTDIGSYEFCEKLCAAGVKNIIYTDISRDGTLSGTNLKAYGRLVKIPSLNVFASGGISSLEEISKLKEMGAAGAVLGKALYENRLDLNEAIKIAEGI